MEDNQLSAIKLADRIGIASRNIESNIKKLKEFLNTKNITISDERLCRLISDTKNNLYDMIDALKKIIKNGYVGL